MADGQFSGEVLYRDYIVLDGNRLTADGLRAQFKLLRQQCMDLPIRVAPIVFESERSINAQLLGESERYALDVSYYDLDDPNSDPRIKNEFQFYEHLMRGIANNQSVLLTRKRGIMRQAADVEIMADGFYAELKTSKGDQMGRSENARKAWFQQHYPCLHEVQQLYKEMLAEMETEKERLQLLATMASRNLTATQDDYQVRGMMGGMRIAGHNE